MILIDTSALIDSLTGPRRSVGRLRSLIVDGHRLAIPTLVLFEWRRGPRLDHELQTQEALLPSEESLPFGPRDASRAAQLYRKVGKPRGREIDLAVAACALERNASLWTLNPRDFSDIEGLKLV